VVVVEWLAMIRAWQNDAFVSSCRPKVKISRPGRGRSFQGKSSFLNFWSAVLIWENLEASPPIMVNDSPWTFLDPQSFIQKYLTADLSSPFSIYR
jgi:hypothetical protein